MEKVYILSRGEWSSERTNVIGVYASKDLAIQSVDRSKWDKYLDVEDIWHSKDHVFYLELEEWKVAQ